MLTLLPILTITLAGFMMPPSVLVKQLGSKHYVERAMAYHELSQRDDPNAWLAVAGGLSNPDIEIRRTCAHLMDRYFPEPEVYPCYMGD